MPAGICYLLLRMAGMEMEMEIEKLAIFFKVLPVYFGEIAKNCAIVCSSLKSESINIPPPPPPGCSTNNFLLEKSSMLDV